MCKTRISPSIAQYPSPVTGSSFQRQRAKAKKRIILLKYLPSELLKSHKLSGYVIGDDHPITQMVARRILRSINRKIDLYGATPYVFHHSYISALAEAGVDLKTIQQIILVQ